MCIIIFKPADKRVSKKMLQRCWSRNDDGGGFMYGHNGRVVIHKAMKFDAFWNLYNNHVLNGSGQGKDVGIHFRISTSGETDLKNCHPHSIRSGLAFMHNGKISGTEPSFASKVSDSVLFNFKVLRKLPKNFATSQGILSLIERYTKTSKLLFMDGNGDHLFVHEDKGQWTNGIWWSNDSWKKHYRKKFAVDYVGFNVPFRAHIGSCRHCSGAIYDNDAADRGFCHSCLGYNVERIHTKCPKNKDHTIYGSYGPSHKRWCVYCRDWIDHMDGMVNVSTIAVADKTLVVVGKSLPCIPRGI